MITEANAVARSNGIHPGMAIADARAAVPSLEVMHDSEGHQEKLLRRFAEWCIRFTPVVAVDLPDGLMLDATGCAHLWKGEKNYLQVIVDRWKSMGYRVRAGMADTAAAAWAVSRFGQETLIKPGRQHTDLLTLPPEALRLSPEHVERLRKLGLRWLGDFIGMPHQVLRRRFGPGIVDRIDKMLGREADPLQPIIEPSPYQERLSSLEPIVTAAGIAIAVRSLLETLCARLNKEGKGIRKAMLSAYRIDGRVEKVSIATSRATHQVEHLFKLFDMKFPQIAPGWGIELFILDALQVEDVSAEQERLWEGSCGLQDRQLAELMDRISNKMNVRIRRYLPAEHYWPERSMQTADSLRDTPATEWVINKPRPVTLLPLPERIEVTAPIPDYPPMLFRYKGQLHTIVRADGPERIEREWWTEAGPHRDYYAVEDQEGRRYWLFRSGHYAAGTSHQWFIHGVFA